MEPWPLSIPSSYYPHRPIYPESRLNGGAVRLFAHTLRRCRSVTGGERLRIIKPKDTLWRRHQPRCIMILGAESRRARLGHVTTKSDISAGLAAEAHKSTVSSAPRVGTPMVDNCTLSRTTTAIRCQKIEFLSNVSPAAVACERRRGP